MLDQEDTALLNVTIEVSMCIDSACADCVLRNVLALLLAQKMRLHLQRAGISRVGAASEVFLPVIVLGFLETADTMGRARLRFKTLEMAAVLFSIFISEHSTHL